MQTPRPDRRSFLKLATAFASMSSTANSPRFRMGLQMYTVRDPMAKDALGTLKQIAALGYRNLETYGFDPAAVTYYGMPAADFRKVLDDLGLTTTTGHYDLHAYLNKPADAMSAYIDRCILGAHA